MIDVVGVRLKKVGKIYYFNANSLKVKQGDDVIVETSLGLKLAKVVLQNKKIQDDEVVSPLKPILKIADDEDVRHSYENEIKAKEAYAMCQQLIIEHNLDMKLINVEYTFDNSIAIFYFNSVNRVDFRMLIKDLARQLHIRIEMRQVPVREHAKMMNLMGSCGRQTCCSSWITKFNLINVKMAKNQDLSLNPYKISGVCGKLMCCLKFENESYKCAKQGMPQIGDIIKIDHKICVVYNTNVLEEKLQIRQIVNANEKDVEKIKKLKGIKGIEESNYILADSFGIFDKVDVQATYMSSGGCGCPKKNMKYDESSEEELLQLESD